MPRMAFRVKRPSSPHYEDERKHRTKIKAVAYRRKTEGHIKKRLHACFLINRNVGTFRLVIQEQDKVDALECINSRALTTSKCIERIYTARVTALFI